MFICNREISPASEANASLSSKTKDLPRSDEEGRLIFLFVYLSDQLPAAAA